MKAIFKISRPRFWLYTFGPYLVGLTAAANVPSDLLRFDVIFFALYFLFPANLLIYGVNDIWDFETDSRNRKKTGYETLVRPEHHHTLLLRIAAFNAPGVTTRRPAIIPRKPISPPRDAMTAPSARPGPAPIRRVRTREPVRARFLPMLP